MRRTAAQGLPYYNTQAQLFLTAVNAGIVRAILRDATALVRTRGRTFLFAKKYGLTEEELQYVLNPAKAKGPGYPSETFRVLKEREIRQYDEYRTERLLLEAWKQIEADGTFKTLGM